MNITSECADTAQILERTEQLNEYDLTNLTILTQLNPTKLNLIELY